MKVLRVKTDGENLIVDFHAYIKICKHDLRAIEHAKKLFATPHPEMGEVIILSTLSKHRISSLKYNRSAIHILVSEALIEINNVQFDQFCKTQEILKIQNIRISTPYGTWQRKPPVKNNFFFKSGKSGHTLAS